MLAHALLLPQATGIGQLLQVYNCLHFLPSLDCSRTDLFTFQVFWTNDGKGWGLRTLEDLPKGTFVCEYVGEVVTNTELDERNKQSRVNERHTYPVQLDADWGSESILDDDYALCLDATSYGNVARFINHRYRYSTHSKPTKRHTDF